MIIEADDLDSINEIIEFAEKAEIDRRKLPMLREYLEALANLSRHKGWVEAEAFHEIVEGE